LKEMKQSIDRYTKVVAVSLERDSFLREAELFIWHRQGDSIEKDKIMFFMEPDSSITFGEDNKNPWEF